MDQSLWLLMEWSEQNTTSKYGVVNINSLMYDKYEFHIGKIVYIRDGHNDGGARQGQILRISFKKHHLAELRVVLQRQHLQDRNPYSSCTDTGNEIDTGSMGFSPNQPQSLPGPCGPYAQHHPLPEASISASYANEQSFSPNQSSSMPFLSRSNALHHQHHVPEASSASYASVQTNELNTTKSTLGYNTSNIQHGRSETATREQINSVYDISNPNILRSIFTSILTERAKGPVNMRKNGIDQEAQTEPLNIVIPRATADELESKLHRLTRQFQKLLADLNVSENQQQERAQERMGPASSRNVDDVRAKPVTRKRNAKGLPVKKASAQSTTTDYGNNEESNDQNLNEVMVSLGTGNVVVPAKLISSDIDWNSYTLATRRLLQAVFPKKVLATHTLTGKQGPAHRNQPNKKRLDPKKVGDIVYTVTRRCGVTKALVRSVISNKCSNEARLYRIQQHVRKLERERDEEDLTPFPTSSNDSSNAGDDS